MMKKFLYLLALSSLLMVGCKNGCNKEGEGNTTNEDSIDINLGELTDSIKRVEQYHLDSIQKQADRDSTLTELTHRVLSVFKNKQYAKLGQYIHPEEGVRFSPYATVLSEDNKFSREAFKKLVTVNKNKKILWGSYDGSGDAIELTPAEYFSQFVYDANFLNPEKFEVNDIIGTGNSVDNLRSQYHNSDFTESYFSGSKKNGGVDWKAVRLVFKKIDGKYYLVGVVHDQWTI